MKIKKSYYLITLLIIIATFFLLNATLFRSSDINNPLNSEETVDNLDNTVTNSNIYDEKNTNKNIYYISVIDKYFTDSNVTFDEFIKSKNAITYLKSFNNELNKNFDFYELTFQPLQDLKYYNHNEKYVVTTKRGKKLLNEKVNIGGDEKSVTTLKSIQLGKRIYFEKLNHVEYGVGFSDQSFKYTINDTIPTILGYDYKSDYKVGDTLNLNYLQRNITFKIIGFFNKDTNIKMNKKLYNLDTYICTPYFDIINTPEDGADKLFQARYYLQKNNGYILVDTKIYIESYYKKIKELAKSNNVEFVPVTNKINIDIQTN